MSRHVIVFDLGVTRLGDGEAYLHSPGSKVFLISENKAYVAFCFDPYTYSSAVTEFTTYQANKEDFYRCTRTHREFSRTWLNSLIDLDE
jgi:hypothetical protein